MARSHDALEIPNDTFFYRTACSGAGRRDDRFHTASAPNSDRTRRQTCNTSAIAIAAPTARRRGRAAMQMMQA